MGCLELEFCRLKPQAQARLELRIWKIDPSLYILAGRPLRPLVILPLLLGFHLDIYYKNPFRFFALLTLKCYGKNDVCIFEKLVTLYSFIAEFSEG